MINIKFVDYIADRLKIERKDLIEKDILLQMILNELVKNKEFRDNFAFKGGTCLIKAYYGYFRFSEDLDFTYLNQTEFEKVSKKKIRKIESNKINELAEIAKSIADKLGLDFKIDKENKDYFEFGGSNAFVTLKIWYNSAVSNSRAFIKIQINFIEKLDYSIKELPAKFIFGTRDEKEINLLFPDYLYLLNPVSIKVYDIREILIEKIRAILTRKGIKARDFADVFLIINREKLNLENFKKEIIGKIKNMLRFEKYSENIKNKEKQLNENIILGEEKTLLLTPMDDGFKEFLKNLKGFLESIQEELSKEKEEGVL